SRLAPRRRRSHDRTMQGGRVSRTDLIQDLQARLAALVDPASHAWWERYLEGAASFRGVRPDHILAAVQDWHNQPQVAGLDAKAAFDLSLELIREPLTEDKLAGMLYVRDALLPRGDVDWRSALPAWA